jgi:two-component system chemotaxis sensor kinase CheA
MDDEILAEFLVESREGLDTLDRLLVELEESPGSRDLLASVFRVVHTFKGTSGFLGLHALEQLAHAGESLLVRLRDGDLSLDRARADALLAMVDALRGIVNEVEATGSEGRPDVGELSRRLLSLCAVSRSSEASVPAPRRVTDELTPSAPRSLVPHGASPSHGAEPVVVPGAAPEVRSDTTVRIDVQLLDKLMNLVGELVLARNQVLQLTGRSEDASLLGTTQRLDLVTTELQEGVMKTRMQPIGSIWNKYPRVVRDLAAQCGKQIRLETEGADTELDRTILEAIKDPLTHILRNSADHGIERPEQRVAAGKPPAGVLRLRAFHEGGKVNIEISDDGAGIAVERVRDKAVARGLVSAERAASMSDREIAQLIFAPGFSTAEAVSAVSGRGVGMDVVKTHVERIGGTIELQSARGRGTTLRIRIPLTLAIIPALLVTLAGERYAIPQVSLVELVRVAKDAIDKSVLEVHGARVLTLRGELLPLVELREVLQLQEAAQPPDDLLVAVVSAEDRTFGLVVDDISDTGEIVVKPLGRELKMVGVYAGATILGDGRVALILDVPGIAERAGLAAGHGETGTTPAGAAPRGELGSWLLVQGIDGTRCALPLAAVARLEEIPLARIERVGTERVAQYRGEILPLVPLGDGWPGTSPDGVVHVVVCAVEDRLVGAVVASIEDVSTAEVDLHRVERADRALAGIPASACAVLAGQVTAIIDVGALVARAGVGRGAGETRRRAA